MQWEKRGYESGERRGVSDDAERGGVLGKRDEDGVRG